MQQPKFNRITFATSRVTIQRSESSPTGYVAIGWNEGLPANVRPVTLAEINSILDRYPNHTIQSC